MPFTILCFTQRHPSLTFDQYKDYYENKHAPLITRLFGDRAPEGYTRYYIDRSAGPEIWITGSPNDYEYDCCTVITWRDKAAYERALEVMGDQAKWQEVVEDEKKFLNREKVKLITVGDGCGPKFF